MGEVPLAAPDDTDDTIGIDRSDEAETSSSVSVIPRWRWMAGAFAMIVIGLGVASLVVARHPGNGSTEAGFIRDFLAHEAAMRDLAAEIRLPPDDPAAAVLSEAAATMENDAAALNSLLDDWGLSADSVRPAMSWMGHLVVGTTPGEITVEAAAATTSSPTEARSAMAMELLAINLEGGLLMSRGVLGLSDHTELSELARSMIVARRDLLEGVDEWFLDQELVPPAWLAPMTTDPGELDHGDPVGSIGDVVDDAMSWLPLVLGVIVLMFVVFGRPARWRGLPLVAGAASLLAGVGHLGLVESHAQDAGVNGVFFAVVGLAQIVGGTVVAFRPSSGTINGVATLAAAMTVIYLAFRVYPPPGSVGPADFDLAGLIILSLQLVAVGVWALRPLGGELSNWGLDVVADVAISGASAGLLAVLVAGGVATGWVIAEMDSRPPSEIDVGFARDMIEHHSQAVQMALIVDGRLTDPVVESFAREIVLFQRFEIGLLNAELDQWGEAVLLNDSTMPWMGMEMPLDEMPGMARDAQLDALRRLEGPTLDEAFLTLMGVHHVGGIQMAEFAAENADDSTITGLSELIARNQEIEIAEYSALMDRLGYAAPAGSLTMAELAEIAEVTTG